MQAMAHDWHRRRHSQRDVEFKLSTSRSGNCIVQYNTSSLAAVGPMCLLTCCLLLVQSSLGGKNLRGFRQVSGQSCRVAKRRPEA